MKDEHFYCVECGRHSPECWCFITDDEVCEDEDNCLGPLEWMMQR